MFNKNSVISIVASGLLLFSITAVADEIDARINQYRTEINNDIYNGVISPSNGDIFQQQLSNIRAQELNDKYNHGNLTGNDSYVINQELDQVGVEIANARTPHYPAPAYQQGPVVYDGEVWVGPGWGWGPSWWGPTYVNNGGHHNGWHGGGHH